MGKEMNEWRTWPLCEEWLNRDICPHCNGQLIIAETISSTIESEVFGAICSSCRRQYTLIAPIHSLTVNTVALHQEERITELTARIEELEAIVKRLAEQLSHAPTPPPITRQEEQPQERDPETQDFRKKYGYLF